MEHKQDLDILMEVVNNAFRLDIMKKTNKRYWVDARKIFSRILMDCGYGSSQIGRFLQKDHATIIHYLKDIDHLMKHDSSLSDKYTECRDIFLDGREPYELSPKGLEQKMSIISLNNRIENLILEKNAFLRQNERFRRLFMIVELVDQRTPKGKEDFILRKINQMFNGLTNYE